jgi:hypothetical protein
MRGVYQMPYKSIKQEKWAHSPSGQKALGASGVKEWDQASKGLKLPEKIGPLRKAARGK